MSNKIITTGFCFLLVVCLGTTVTSQPTATPVSQEEKKSANLVDLEGSIRRPGEMTRDLQSGWASFLQPGDEVLITLSTEEGSQSEAKVATPQGHESKKVYLAKRGHTLRWEVSGGAIKEFSGDSVIWQAPFTPGSQKVSALMMDEAVFSRIEPDQNILAEKNILGTFVFHFLVMYPFSPEDSSVIEGYPIGIYPNEKDENVREPVFSRRQAYSPPEYFIKVTPENASFPISEYFTIGDFVSGDIGEASFIALDMTLVERLDSLVEALKKKGVETDGLTILRGYVSPNRAEFLRRKDVDISTFSRLLYGDSVVFIVDANEDGQMDDLTGDGKVDDRDFALIESIVEELESDTGIYGGLGFYYHFKDPDHEDTPCIQIDTRGWRSRWGEQPEITQETPEETESKPEETPVEPEKTETDNETEQ